MIGLHLPQFHHGEQQHTPAGETSNSDPDDNVVTSPTSIMGQPLMSPKALMLASPDNTKPRAALSKSSSKCDSTQPAELSSELSFSSDEDDDDDDDDDQNSFQRLPPPPPPQLPPPQNLWLMSPRPRNRINPSFSSPLATRKTAFATVKSSISSPSQQSSSSSSSASRSRKRFPLKHRRTASDGFEATATVSSPRRFSTTPSPPTPRRLKKQAQSTQTTKHRRNRSSITTSSAGKQQQQQPDPDSLSSLKSALRLRRDRHGDSHPSVADAWNLLGNFHFSTGDFHQAIRSYKQAVQCDPGPHLAIAYSNMGTAYWNMHNMSQAIVCLKMAVAELEFAAVGEGRSPESCASLSSTWYRLGVAYTLEQSYDLALEGLANALSIQQRQTQPNMVLMARILDAMGKVYWFRGEYDDAMEQHLQALSMKQAAASAANNPQDNVQLSIIASWTHIGAVHHAKDDFPQAVEAYQKVSNCQMKQLAKCRQQRKPFLRRSACEAGDTLFILGDLYAKQGLVAQAVKSYKSAVLVYREGGDKNKIKALNDKLAHLRAA